MSGINKVDLDNYITGHWGEDQFRDDEPEDGEELIMEAGAQYFLEAKPGIFCDRMIAEEAMRVQVIGMPYNPDGENVIVSLPDGKRAEVDQNRLVAI